MSPRPKRKQRRGKEETISPLEARVAQLEQRLAQIQQKYDSRGKEVNKLRKENKKLKQTLEQGTKDKEGRTRKEKEQPGFTSEQELLEGHEEDEDERPIVIKEEVDDAEEDEDEWVLGPREDGDDWHQGDNGQEVEDSESSNDGEQQREKIRVKRTVKKESSPKTELEGRIVSFLNEVLSRPKSAGHRTGTKHQGNKEKDCFDPQQLQPFAVVLRKRVESLVEEALGLDRERMVPTYIDKPYYPRKRGSALQYFPVAPVNRAESATEELKSENGQLENDPLDTEVPLVNNGKRKRRTKGDTLVQPKIKTFVVNPVIEDNNDPSVYRCHICNRIWESKPQLQRHVLRHVEKSEPCPRCGKLFKVKSDIAKHIAYVHDRIRRFQCSMCPMTFIDGSGLNRHERRHLGIKNHLCIVCGRAFPEAINLRLHMKQHDGVTPNPRWVPPVMT